MNVIQIGAFPFTIRNGKLKVMIVTNCSGKAWILPKGNTESDMKNAQVACLEASEEAGVVGKLVISEGYKDFKSGNGGLLRVYPLEISRVMAKWPERKIRRRELVSVKEALSLVTRKEHANAIIYYSKSRKLM